MRRHPGAKGVTMRSPILSIHHGGAIEQASWMTSRVVRCLMNFGFELWDEARPGLAPKAP